jgi:hypothetical protein
VIPFHVSNVTVRARSRAATYIDALFVAGLGVCLVAKRNLKGAWRALGRGKRG